MATVEANAVALEKELIIYEKGIPELLEVDTALLSMMDKEESDPASNRASRIPLLTAIQGTFQQTSMDGADMGATSGPVWNVATLSPIYFTGGYSYTALAKFATTGTNRAVKSVTGEVMRLSVEQQRSANDIMLNTAGTGVVGTITSVSTNALTMTTDGFKEQMVYVGMPVQVYDTTLATNRGATTVASIDHINHVINVAAAPGGTVATDKLVIGGLSGTLTIQSSVFGIQYHQNDATSGLWLNLNRATLPQVVTPSINANSSALTTAFIRQALNAIRIRLGDNFFRSEDTKLVPYMHPAQADAYEALAVNISQIFKDPSGNQSVDLLFGGNTNDSLTMGGLKTRTSIHQDRTRIDFLCMNCWGRIVAADTGFYKVGDQIIWPVYASGGASLVSSEMFYIKNGYQVYTRNPQAGSYIKTLAVPSGTAGIY